ncbi:hypothetical protein CO116_00910 [Candidatus Falkowbacteria bacterium CG_4_9_14_3_um_filter_38_19]|uniref:Uncharacterized protein n=1 Tax=Candidatus Falkowbacteria bacterium CG_4_9_14_3_um_filter_38_19 TaxID=1974559 RepID=A0A2M8AIH7_9BACT|nr:hypothetical protein [Candidatus Falkowbacteria bacterium]PJB17423.1 MAG: hypothetical protein CO116_00910 [Candidatus Falkowbacteria bacterium CG_4_9_14_3_um_filter_38_19]
MIKISIKKILTLFCLAILFFAFLLAPSAYQSLKWQQAVEAAGGFPYQIGLTKVVIVNCVTTGIPPICTGGILCNTLDAARCPLYVDVSGTPAGGMGKNALFSLIAIGQAGLTAGGQLIAGGMSPVLMDSGVLASAGGCYGCVAKNSLPDKFLAWFDKYIIAGFRKK